MNRIHMTLKMTSPREAFSTRVALESLLLEMDSLVVALHGTRARKDFVACQADARNLNSNRPLLIATGILLATIPKMHVEEMLR